MCIHTLWVGAGQCKGTGAGILAEIRRKSSNRRRRRRKGQRRRGRREGEGRRRRCRGRGRKRVRETEKEYS